MWNPTTIDDTGKQAVFRKDENEYRNEVFSFLVCAAYERYGGRRLFCRRAPAGNAPVLIDFMVENGQSTKEKSIMKDPGGGPVTAPEAINPAATERVKAPTGGP